MSNWYKEISPGEPISQGDIFFDCPIFMSLPTINPSDPRNITEVETIIDNADVVVMTQACDLENRKTESVVVAMLWDPLEMKLENKNRWEFISEVHAGRRPNYALIGKHSSENITMRYKIVEFSRIFTLPYEFLMNFSEYHGLRLRLNTPHRELLSQQFGNYFSRIGLPNEDFINKKQLKNELFPQSL
jgi:hypothetical protein